MKKAVLALAALLATAWAAPAAAAEFSYGGFMRYRYIGGNPGTVSFDDGGSFYGFTNPDDAASFWEYRIRQFFNLKVNDHVSTNVKFEWNSQFGRENVLGGGSGDLQLGPGATSEFQFRVKNAFVKFDVPGIPVTLTVGQQDFSTPKAIISVEDGTGIKLNSKLGAVDVTLFWQRLRETANFQTGADNADWFGIVPVFTAGDLKISPHLSWVHAGTGATNDVFGLGATEALDVYYIGIDTSGKAGPLGFTADAILQTGSVKTTGGDVDLMSYYIDLSASLALGPGTLTAKFAYSPGDDNLADNDFDAWQNIVATDLGFTPLFHDGSSNSGFAGTVLPGVSDAGLIGFGVELALSPVKDVTLTPNVYYLMAAEDRVGATGDLAPSNGENVYGVELGVQANWRMYDAVNFLAQFDYLAAGDFFKTASVGTKDVWRLILGPSISW